ncbi:MAG: regulatory protein RecX [Bacteroidia bacterium]
MPSPKIYTVQQALEQMQKYCAYQERCSEDVRIKLVQMGIRGMDAENIIVALISENYLNESRYASAFARGKFKNNHWGRIKIEFELKRRKISGPNIRKGLSQISESDYQAMILKLTKKLDNKATYKHDRKALMVLYRKLMQRGFETDSVRNVLGASTED